MFNFAFLVYETADFPFLGTIFSTESDIIIIFLSFLELSSSYSKVVLTGPDYTITC